MPIKTVFFVLARMAPSGPQITCFTSLEVGRIVMELIESLLTQGMPALHTPAQEFNTMIKSDYAKWSGIIKAANIKPE